MATLHLQFFSSLCTIINSIEGPRKHPTNWAPQLLRPALPLDHASPTTTQSQAAGNDSRLCRARNTQNPLCGKTKAAPHDRDLPDKR